MIRVAFAPPLSKSWIGGINYYRNLFLALRELPAGTVEPVVFSSLSMDESLLRELGEVKIVRTPLLERRTVPHTLRRVVCKTTRVDAGLSLLFRRHGVDVFSHVPEPLFMAQPTIGWIPDFQHLHLPQLFTEEDRRLRDRDYRWTARTCDTILVSSEDALRDLGRFVPQAREKGRVLRFVAMPPRHADVPSRAELEQRFQFSGPFFFLPNQIWQHKNHKVVIEAVAIARSRGQKLLVLASGNPDDFRAPGHFAELQKLVSDRGVGEAFRFLGLLPYRDVVGLLTHSTAVINPSLFEGWSTTVEESKSMGKRLLLSDLAVHREQAPERGSFFDPNDPEALAKLMAKTQAEHDPVADRKAADRAAELLPTRARAYAERYLELLREVI